MSNIWVKQDGTAEAVVMKTMLGNRAVWKREESNFMLLCMAAANVSEEGTFLLVHLLSHSAC